MPHASISFKLSKKDSDIRTAAEDIRQLAQRLVVGPKLQANAHTQNVTSQLN